MSRRKGDYSGYPFNQGYGYNQAQEITPQQYQQQYQPPFDYPQAPAPVETKTSTRRSRKQSSASGFGSSQPTAPSVTQEDVRAFMLRTMLPRLLKEGPSASALGGSKRKQSTGARAWVMACQELGYMTKNTAKRIPRKTDPEYAMIKQRADQIAAELASASSSSGDLQTSSAGNPGTLLSGPPPAELGPNNVITRRGWLPVGFIEMMDRATGYMYAEPDPSFVSELVSAAQCKASRDLFAMESKSAVLRRLFKIVAQKKHVQ